MSKQKLPKTLGILTLLVGFLFSFTVHAQFDTAAVLGTVSDESGGIIPGVTVTLTNVDTGISATTVTDDSGNYQFFNVKIGTYRVSAELTGFATGVADGIRPTVNSRQRVNLVLQVGEISQVVEVVGAAPLIESDTSDRGEVIQAKEIVGLPLNGREYSDLTLLAPGVRESEKDESRQTQRSIRSRIIGIRRDVRDAGAQPRSVQLLRPAGSRHIPTSQRLPRPVTVLFQLRRILHPIQA